MNPATDSSASLKDTGHVWVGGLKSIFCSSISFFAPKPVSTRILAKKSYEIIIAF